MNGKSFPKVSHVLEQHVTQLMIGGIIISIRTIKKKLNKHLMIKITKLKRIGKYVEVVILKWKPRQEYTLSFFKEIYSNYHISNFILKQIFNELNIYMYMYMYMTYLPEKMYPLYTDFHCWIFMQFLHLCPLNTKVNCIIIPIKTIQSNTK